MTWTMVSKISVAVALAVTMTACSGIKKQLGQTKQAPDEFRVVARAPLTMPPDFTLRPPEPGAPRPQEGTTADQARQAIFRAEEPKAEPETTVASADTRSPGELSLLRSAGAENVDPDIRQVVERETLRLNEESQSFIDSLVFWRDKEAPGVVVDAQSESQRLKENAALGKDVTSGQTPTIERRQKAIFEGLF